MVDIDTCGYNGIDRCNPTPTRVALPRATP